MNMQTAKSLQSIQATNDPFTELSFRAKLIHKLAKVFPPLSASPAESGGHAQWEFKKASGSYQKYVDAIGGLQNKTVLDFGCGWGGETAWLANQCAHATGCDINTAALKDAKAFKEQQKIGNVDFVACTATTIDLPDNHFDAVNKQLERTPDELPTLWINPDVTDINDFTMDDVKLVDYNPQETIKAPMAV